MSGTGVLTCESVLTAHKLAKHDSPNAKEAASKVPTNAPGDTPKVDLEVGAVGLSADFKVVVKPGGGGGKVV